MRLIDLSQPVYDACPNCPDHPPVQMEIISAHDRPEGETWHMERLSLASHTGSHVDAPLHKLRGGATLDDIPLERWQGRAIIADVRGLPPRGSITAAMLREKMSGQAARDAFVLLCTGWGGKRARTREWLHDAVTLSAEGAQWLADEGARGVGIDHYSIGDAATHAILLARPVLIVEELFFPAGALALRGPAEFWALPMRLRGASGAPCRPVLVLREDA